MDKILFVGAGRPATTTNFRNFLNNNARAAIHGRLAALVQQGNGKAYQELETQLQKPLIGHIKWKYGETEDYAREICYQAWNRWLDAIKEKSGLFNPDGRQTFEQYLINKARTLLKHDGANISSLPGGEDDDTDYPDILDTLAAPPSAAAKTVVLPELLRLFFRCGAKPHQVLAAALVKLLEYRPKEDVVPRFGNKTLNQLADEFQRQYFNEIRPYRRDEASFWRECEYDRFQGSLQRHVREIYVEPNYAQLGKTYATVGEMPLAAFFRSREGPAKDIHDWSDKVRTQVKERLLRMDGFFWLFRCGEKPHKVLPAGFIEFLKYDAARVATDLGGSPLNSIMLRFREESFPVFAAWELSSRHAARHYEQVLVLEHLNRKTVETYPEPEYEPVRNRYGREMTGIIPLHLFFPFEQSPELAIDRWSKTIKDIKQRAIKLHDLARKNIPPHLTLLQGFKEFLKYTMPGPATGRKAARQKASIQDAATLLPLTLGQLSARFKQEYFADHIEDRYWGSAEQFWEYCCFYLLTNKLDDPVGRYYQGASQEGLANNCRTVAAIPLARFFTGNEAAWKNFSQDEKDGRE